MNEGTAQRLIELNNQFYQTFAPLFSATRQRLQPGIRRLIEELPSGMRVLDLGCGNGQVWKALQKRGWQGEYIGLDFSARMLQEAKTNPASLAPGNPDHAPVAKALFFQADLSGEDWDAALPGALFDAIFAFAVLHHLPGETLRLHVLSKARRLLVDSGLFYHSEWQFLNSPRLRSRLQAWETLGLSAGQVDEGDYLLDWRHGGYSLRYVHHFDEDELARLALASGFQVIETFRSDGEGGQLGIYQIWKA
jgi:tRNA (uracil-5-)-methyltransferase TRM9